MEITQTQIQTHSPPARALARRLTRTSTMAADRFKVFWGSVVRRAGIKRKGKTLSVRETAALGDRRFVSVVQFERQRFLIGSSPSAVTLLAQLPDEFASGAETGEVSEEQFRKEGGKESGKEAGEKN
jgi:hypothetical protein